MIMLIHNKLYLDHYAIPATAFWCGIFIIHLIFIWLLSDLCGKVGIVLLFIQDAFHVFF